MMPPSRSDARALAIAVVSLVVAGVVVALFLFWGTRAPTPTPDAEGRSIVPLGPAPGRYDNLANEGPVYIANPFGGPGMLLALEDDEIVALVVEMPGRDGCTADWQGQDETFVDCDRRPIDSTDLARFEVTIPTEGDRAGELVVDVGVILAPPG